MKSVKVYLYACLHHQNRLTHSMFVIPHMKIRWGRHRQNTEHTATQWLRWVHWNSTPTSTVLRSDNRSRTHKHGQREALNERHERQRRQRRQRQQNEQRKQRRRREKHGQRKRRKKSEKREKTAQREWTRWQRLWSKKCEKQREQNSKRSRQHKWRWQYNNWWAQ